MSDGPMDADEPVSPRKRHRLVVEHVPGIKGRSKIEVDGADIADAVAGLQITLTSRGVEAVIETMPGQAVSTELEGVLVELVDESSKLAAVTSFIEEINGDALEDAMLEGSTPVHGVRIYLRQLAEEWARG